MTAYKPITWVCVLSPKTGALVWKGIQWKVGQEYVSETAANEPRDPNGKVFAKKNGSTGLRNAKMPYFKMKETMIADAKAEKEARLKAEQEAAEAAENKIIENSGLKKENEELKKELAAEKEKKIEAEKKAEKEAKKTEVVQAQLKAEKKKAKKVGNKSKTEDKPDNTPDTTPETQKPDLT